MKKSAFLCLLLAAALLLTACGGNKPAAKTSDNAPQTAAQSPKAANPDDFTYKLYEDDHTATVASYKGTNTEIVFPSAWQDYTVTRIAGDFYCEKEGLKVASLYIPGSIVSIEENAFSSLDNDSLVSVTLCEGLQYIGAGAFSNKPRLKTINFPEGLMKIGQEAFSGCESLTEAIFPASLKTIGDWAFQYCSNLQRVVFSNSPASIGDSAFDSCEKLTSLSLGNAVTQIGRCAFSGTGLTSLTIPASVTKMDEGIAYGCNLESIVLEEGAKTVRLESLIYGPQHVSGLWIPASVNKIELGLYEYNSLEEDVDVFHVVPGSYAEQFCQEHGIKYVTD